MSGMEAVPQHHSLFNRGLPEAPELTLLRRKPCSRVGADPCRDSQCHGAVLPDPACQLPCSLYAKFQTLLTPPFDTSVEKDQWQEQ